MHKEIEKAVLKITQAMEKNRNAYNEARGSFCDTGYDRYQKKMDRLDAEYEELRVFIHPRESAEVQPQIVRECEEMRRILKSMKSKWQHLRTDLPVSVGTIGIDDLLRDVR